MGLGLSTTWVGWWWLWRWSLCMIVMGTYRQRVGLGFNCSGGVRAVALAPTEWFMVSGVTLCFELMTWRWVGRRLNIWKELMVTLYFRPPQRHQLNNWNALSNGILWSKVHWLIQTPKKFDESVVTPCKIHWPFKHLTPKIFFLSTFEAAGLHFFSPP